MQIFGSFILICIFCQTFKSLSIFSGANAQSAEQIEMARQLGIDIDDYIDKSQNYETSIGQQYEDFVIAPDDKDEPQNWANILVSVSLRIGTVLSYSLMNEKIIKLLMMLML